jgi:hypothetical protein
MLAGTIDIEQRWVPLTRRPSADVGCALFATEESATASVSAFVLSPGRLSGSGAGIGSGLGKHGMDHDVRELACLLENLGVAGVAGHRRHFSPGRHASR